ncbi:M56 family metallopeptidase [Yinghuangia soli]|uniref:M56 family metallopeptidase n=1 Tax=Yinghuangia soli TaxID=2908204 RepID=A0AA41U6R8_9ACTN|nr:M56 family metallopeptidase [Yinghuangia soli]MCF2533297.1 M56 family metallopeptidase [Yinghuangia soli]
MTWFGAQAVFWAALVGAGAMAPHAAARCFQLDRVRPMAAVAVWAAGMVLRAVAAVAIVLLAVVCLPHTPRIPRGLHDLPTGFGSDLAATSTMLLALTGAALVVLARRFRAADREMGARMRPLPIKGPGGSVVVADSRILLAAVGLRRPRVVVSAGALGALDDAELDAALAHEQGHIRRAHRWVVAGAEVCLLLARWLPGTRYAHRELGFHLERDADWWAVRRCHDPNALAAAVCKAALDDAEHGTGGARGAARALAGAGAGHVTRRVRLLLDGCPTGTARRNAAVRLVASALLALTVAAGAATLSHVGAGLAECAAPHACTASAQEAARPAP